MASDPTSAPRPGGPRDSRGGGDRKPVRLGKYEVVKHIANGGMGAVYKARDTEACRDVALKVLPREMAEKPAMLERFRREARSAAKLRHGNIVTVYEAGDFHGTFYLAMELVEGVDLHDHVKRHGPLDGEEARQVVLQAAHALRHAHEMGIVHRDVKPSNFLLSWDGGSPRVKLLDFGLAREVEDDLSRVTRAGTTVGTIDYMSPEQARDSGSADIRSDLYSLGATWFYLLAGRPTFQGGMTERLLKLMQEEPPELPELNPAVSDEAWDVVRRLLAKSPGDRYQTPDELIEALEALEGRCHADPRRPRARPKERRGPSALVAPAPAVPAPSPSSQPLWYTLAAGAALLLVGVAAVVVTMPRRPPEVGSHSPPAAPAASPLRAGPTPPPPPVLGGPAAAPSRGAEPAGLRPLYLGARAVDVASLRGQLAAPAVGEPPRDDVLTVRVSRAAAPSPTSFRSLGDAFRAGAPGQPLVVEVHDNGPLFEPGLDPVEGRDLWLRAGPGYRPLIVWDVQAGPAAPGKAQPPVFLPTRGGRLSVDGVELALRWPEGLAGPAAVFDVRDGALAIRDSTLSVAGKPAGGVALARYASKHAGGACSFTRCQARGAGVTALEMEAPDAAALFDGCLVVGGQQPLLRFRTWVRPTRCQVVRSTMVGGPSLVELRPAGAGEEPLFDFLGWDSLLCGVGTLFDFQQGGPARGVKWHAVNCLYAGWKTLLPGAADHAAWQRRWGLPEGDAALAEPWPEPLYNEPATQPAATYQPAGPVLYASTADPRKPLGCDLAALPPCRDGWVSLALDGVIAAPDLPDDDAAPEIPLAEEGLYAGGVIDAATCDVGAALARVKRFAPRVVLHLKGSGEVATSPIRLKGVHLVLHFEEPPDRDTPPLTLTLARSTAAVPLVDLDGGNLDVIGGGLRVPDQSGLKASHVIRVRGGDVRLYRARVEGPRLEVPEGYVAAVSVAGSGDPAPEKGRSLAANECVVLSSQAGVVLDGVGCRASLRQCLVVAGRDGLRLLPGKACQGRAGMGVALTNVTFACQRAVAYLGDAPSAGVPADPVAVQARDCAYLNPFPGKPSKAGLLVWEGDALRRGLLVWRGQGEGFDSRLHFAAAPSAGGISDTKEGYGPWARLWGAGGARGLRPLSHLLGFDQRRWALERLALKMRGAPGANLDRLGVAVRKPTR